MYLLLESTVSIFEESRKMTTKCFKILNENYCSVVPWKLQTEQLILECVDLKKICTRNNTNDFKKKIEKGFNETLIWLD